VSTSSEERYFTALAAAFVRGRMPEVAPLADDGACIVRGAAAGLRLHKFKRNTDLPRVRRVLGVLRGLGPTSLLDVGSGRGTFLWPLLDAFPALQVTAIDADPRRAGDLDAVRRGGVSRLSAHKMNAEAVTFDAGAFDVVTLLEVLEHMHHPELAVAHAVRVARRFVVASVPSKEDDNPEHIHLFDAASLTALFANAGAPDLHVDYVRGHVIAVATLMSTRMQKYPRTPHLEGSRLQPGDADVASVPFATVAGRHLVVEEKMDGANAAISFDANGALLLQSRGHYLEGGAREKHFDLFKRWAGAHRESLHACLGDRYVLYGEWLYAKHTIYYDALSHYFLEFDVLDTQDGAFLSTGRRRALLEEAPVASVAVLFEGRVRKMRELLAWLGRSRFKTAAWRENLARAAERAGQDPARIAAETDPSDEMEGLYVKFEEDGHVTGRFKYVRASFLTTVVDSGTHWLNRPIVPNDLAPGTDLFSVAT
jgi:SAM-dependent methyltransferase